MTSDITAVGWRFANGVVRIRSLKQLCNVDVTNWAAFTPQTSSNPPQFSMSAGPSDAGYSSSFSPAYVSYSRDFEQFLDGGARRINLRTGGGLTIVAVVRFTGSPGSWERILDVGNGRASENILLARKGTSDSLVFRIYEGSSTVCSFNSSGAIVQDQWMTIVARYSAATNTVDMLKDGTVLGSAQCSATPQDRTVAMSYVARSHWGDDYLNADLAGLVAFAEYLDDASAVEAASRSMTVAPSMTTCKCTLCEEGTFLDSEAASSSCQRCAAGFYQDTAGSYTCKNCPLPNTTSYAGATSNASCSCAPGYYEDATTMPPSCKSCEQGSYKGVIGSQRCSLCHPGSYVSAAAATTCIDCPTLTPKSEIGSDNIEDCGCADKSFSRAIIDGVTSCICSKGFKKDLEAETCSDCPPGEFSSSLGSTICSNCPLFSFPSGDRSRCLCIPGYGASELEVAGSVNYTSLRCFACPMGKYTTNMSENADCDACPSGTYSNAPLASSSCLSLDCPAGTFQGNCTAKVYSFSGDAGEGEVMGGLANGDAVRGLISDGSTDYNNGARENWLISAGCGHIVLKFDSFDTQKDHDFVTLYQCSCQECRSPVELARLHGSGLYADGSGDAVSNNDTFTSTAGYLLVVLTSDASVTGRGFVATWTIEDIPMYGMRDLRCIPCPAIQHYSSEGSNSLDDCTCPPNSVLNSGGTGCACDTGFGQVCYGFVDGNVQTVAELGSGEDSDSEDSMITGLAATPDNTMIIAVVGNRVMILESSSDCGFDLINTIGSQWSGFQDGFDPQFDSPLGVAVSPNGEYAIIIDSGNRRIRAMRISTGEVTTLAGSGSDGYEDGLSGSAKFAELTGAIAITPDGAEALVAEALVMRAVNITSGEVRTLCGIGGVDYTNAGYQDGACEVARFLGISGIAISMDGAIAFITDQYNHRIRAVNLAARTVSTLAGAPDPCGSDSDSPSCEVGTWSLAPSLAPELVFFYVCVSLSLCSLSLCSPVFAFSSRSVGSFESPNLHSLDGSLSRVILCFSDVCKNIIRSVLE